MRPTLALLLAALALAPLPGAVAAEPLLDEGLATYAAARRLRERTGGTPAGVRIGGLDLPLPLSPLDPFAAMRARLAANDLSAPPPSGSPARLSSPGDDPLASERMALALAEIESRVGQPDFDRALALFARRPRLGPERGDDLLRALGAVTGEDLSSLWRELTGRPGLSDVGIAIAASRPDPARPGVEQGQVTLVHRGGPRLPVAIELLFADGARHRVAWDGRDDWLRIRSQGPRLVAVRLNPDRPLPLAGNRLDDTRLVDADPGLRRRVTQRLRFLAQLFLEALADLA